MIFCFLSRNSRTYVKNRVIMFPVFHVILPKFLHMIKKMIHKYALAAMNMRGATSCTVRRLLPPLSVKEINVPRSKTCE